MIYVPALLVAWADPGHSWEAWPLLGHPGALQPLRAAQYALVLVFKTTSTLNFVEYLQISKFIYSSQQPCEKLTSTFKRTSWGA